MEEKNEINEQTEAWEWDLPSLKKGIIDLYNSDEFRLLMDFYNKKSFFDILEISRREKSHTVFLQWLFSHEESHQLGDFAVRKLLEVLVLIKQRQKPLNDALQFPDSPKNFEELIIFKKYDLEEVVCKRESQNACDFDNREPDLVISFDIIPKTDDITGESDESREERYKISIIIENKIDANEGDKQTIDYYNSGEKNLEGEKIYVFLLPVPSIIFEEKFESVFNKCECDKFIIINYQYFADYVLEPCLAESTHPETRLFIKEYLRTLGRPSRLVIDDGKTKKKERTIMIIPKDERELLNKFWSANSGIMQALLQARSEDPSAPPEERELAERTARQVSVSSNPLKEVNAEIRNNVAELCHKAGITDFPLEAKLRTFASTSMNNKNSYPADPAVRLFEDGHWWLTLNDNFDKLLRVFIIPVSEFNTSGWSLKPGGSNYSGINPSRNGDKYYVKGVDVTAYKIKEIDVSEFY